MNKALIAGIFTALLIALGLMAACGGENAEENKDNFDSRVACTHYCTKHFDCRDEDPTAEETSDCVANCRNDIEDNCGNDNQQAANDQIEECVDKDCTAFAVCMVFDAAPECFGFADENGD